MKICLILIFALAITGYIIWLLIIVAVSPVKKLVCYEKGLESDTEYSLLD